MPLFIAIEGIDGSGTTTQSVRLRDALLQAGQRCHLTAEPTGGPVGSAIRLVLGHRLRLTETADPAADEALLALYFAADRLDHLLNEVQPALDSGSHVVTDRYYLSSFAYQSTHCDLGWIRQLNARCRRPDITLLLDLEPAVCLERIGKSRHGLERYEKLESLSKIRQNYLAIAETLRSEGEHIVLIDAGKSMSDIEREILRTIESML